MDTVHMSVWILKKSVQYQLYDYKHFKVGVISKKNKFWFIKLDDITNSVHFRPIKC